MSVTDSLRHEHADLLPRVAELDTIADGLDHWRAATPDELRAIVEFLRDHLVPHARAEEAEAAGLFARMSAVAHPREGAPHPPSSEPEG